MSMAMPLPPTHPRSPVKGNMVSQRATPAAPAWPEHQHNTTAPPVRPEAHKPQPATALHITPHTTLTGRWSVFQGCSTTIQHAARHQHNITAIAPPRAHAGSCQTEPCTSGHPCVSAFPVFRMLGSTLCGAKRSQRHRTIRRKL
eukprot:scaffold23449_cov131-Isochrysis_galbana.AAC.4